ncbi:MAG: acyl-homoserine-lactone synthase [Caulobacter sp.]|nr:acyl-homoserine-lactone synthase [Caulobacter sp.]
MILLLNAANRDAFPALLDDMFHARHEVFVEGRGWEELRSPDGRDIDARDDAAAVYLLALDGDRVLAGARLTGAEGPTLAAEMLPELFETAPPSGPDILEMSRLFARSETAVRDLLSPAVSEVLVAAVELARIVGARGILSLFDLRLAQILLAWGGHPEPLGLPRRARDGVTVAVLNHATPLAARNLRKARRLGRPAVWWADSPSDTPRPYPDILRADPLDPDWTAPGDGSALQRAGMAPHALAEAYWRDRLA